MANHEDIVRKSLIDNGKVKIALSYMQVTAVYNVVYDVAWPAKFIELLKVFHVSQPGPEASVLVQV